MAVNLRDTAAAAASLALKMGSTAADAIVFMAELGEKLPFLEPVLGTILAIREKVETVERNGEELAELEERCTYITACVIEKHSETPTSEMDVTPLKTCVEAVESFVELCGSSSRRARFVRFLKASNDKDEISGLNARVDRLTADLGLAGIVIVENKVDNLKTILEAMDKSHTAKQEQMLAMQASFKRRQQSFKMRQESFKRRQEEFGERLPKMPGRLAKVPIDAPASKSWHVERRRVMEAAFEALTENGGPRLVGLVGDSGSGKTTAASNIVRSPEVREAFYDGIVWMSINKGADTRLPSLMMQLANKVYDIGGSVGRAPGKSDDGAAYIKQRMQEGHVGKGLKCLLVADNVWEKGVVLKLVETGLWVLLSTRDEELVKSAQGNVVGVYKMSMADAKSVLRSAAEIPPGVDLPDNAVDLINLCGRVPMDLAFVGRWSTVRNKQQRESWSDAANAIRIEMDKVRAASEGDAVEDVHVRRRNAILRAGFDDLGVGSDDIRVSRLYLSLAMMPDSHAFTVKDAAVLLCDVVPSAEDVASTNEVLETLERWTVVRSTEGTYHMHDAHSMFARERLMDRGDVRRPALARWVGYISSLDALRSIDPFVLKELWLAVKRVGGDGWDESRLYTAALNVMSESDPLLRDSIQAIAEFQEAQEDWETAGKTWRRLLDVENRELGPDHSFVLNTFESLVDCAERLGNATEAADWRRKGRETLPLTLARERLQLNTGTVEEVVYDVGYQISTWASDHASEETMLRDMLAIQEVNLGQNDIRVANTLRVLGVCVLDAGRLAEAEELLKRCLAIREMTLNQEDINLADTLHELGRCLYNAEQHEKAEMLFRRCLGIQEAKLGPEDVSVANTLFYLGVCIRDTGRLQEAAGLLERCLAIEDTKLGQEDMGLGCTLHELGMCLWSAERLQEAEALLKRCLAIREIRLGQEDMNLAYTLHDLGRCLFDAERPEEAEAFLRRSLVIKEAKLGPEDVNMTSTLHYLGICIRDAGRLQEAEGLLGRCLAIRLTTLGQQDMGLAYTLHELGICLYGTERVQEAEVLLRRCLVIKEAKVGRDDLSVADTLSVLGECLQTAGRLEEAEDLLRRCLAIEESTLGRDSIYVASTLLALGVCVRETDRPEEAEKLLRRSLAIRETTLGHDDKDLVSTLHELGRCLCNAERLQDAEVLLRRCLVIKEAKLGPEDVIVANILYELGVCVRDAGRLDEAEKLLRRCLVIDAKLGRDDVSLADTLYALGKCLRTAGRLEEAEECLRRCLVIREAKLGGKGVEVACTLYNLGECIRDSGRLEEAEVLLGRCLSIEESTLGRYSIEVASTLLSLGVCVRKADRLDEAEKVLRRCLAIREAKLGQEADEIASILYELGVCVRKAGRLEEAGYMLRRCLSLREVMLGPQKRLVGATLHEIGLCIRPEGRLEEGD